MVKNVKVPLSTVLEADSRLLQKVVDDGGRVKHSSCVEVDLNEFSETRRVIVFESFRVTEGLEKRVGVKDLLFNRCLAFLALHSLSLRWLLVQEVFLWAVKTFTSPR